MNFAEALEWMRERPGRECLVKIGSSDYRFRFNGYLSWWNDSYWDNEINLSEEMLDADWRPVGEEEHPPTSWLTRHMAKWKPKEEPKGCEHPRAEIQRMPDDLFDGAVRVFCPDCKTQFSGNYQPDGVEFRIFNEDGTRTRIPHLDVGNACEHEAGQLVEVWTSGLTNWTITPSALSAGDKPVAKGFAPEPEKESLRENVIGWLEDAGMSTKAAGDMLDRLIAEAIGHHNRGGES